MLNDGIVVPLPLQATVVQFSNDVRVERSMAPVADMVEFKASLKAVVSEGGEGRTGCARVP